MSNSHGNNTRPQRLFRWLDRHPFLWAMLLIIAVEVYLLFMTWPMITAWIRDPAKEQQRLAGLSRKNHTGLPEPGTFESTRASELSPISYDFADCNPAAHLIDGNEESMWVSASVTGDTMVAFYSPEPIPVYSMSISMAQLEGQLMMRDLTIVASDEFNTSNIQFRAVRGRCDINQPFSEIITVPANMKDREIVILELDSTDNDWRPSRVWGIACASASANMIRNYATNDQQMIAAREMNLHTNRMSIKLADGTFYVVGK